MCLSAVLGVGSALVGASSSKKAAGAQVAAANQQTALEREIYGETTERFQPFYSAGQNALNAYMYELGLGEKPTFGGNALAIDEFTETLDPGSPVLNGPNLMGEEPGYDAYQHGYRPATTRTGYTVGDQVFYDREAAENYANNNKTGGMEYGGFEETPWQNYIMEQGQRSIDASAASRGKLNSGATLKALSDYGQTTGNQFYQNYLAQLSGASASGQNAAGNMATAGANYATGAGNALGAMGNAQAAGAIGVGNALNTGIGNVLGVMNYQNMQGASSYAPTNSLRPVARPF